MANLSLFVLALLLFINMSQATHHRHENETKHNGLSFTLIRRDSLDSPLYLSNETTRLSRHNFSISKITRDPIAQPSMELDDGIYFVQVGIGTFQGLHPSFKSYYLVLDTGSSTIWTQCHGCDPCFRQQDPVFPKHQSQTYRQLPCGQCPPGATCGHNVCTVNYEYLGGTRVQGISASETFTFVSNNAGFFVTAQNLQFLCVIRSNNVALGKRSYIASGILGMNRHPSSFMGQVGARFGGRFSYCFPRFHRYLHGRPRMFLRFGDDIPRDNLRYRTPLIQGPQSRYYLDLQAITVDNDRLDIDSSVFRLREDGSGGSYISSGSRNTWLVDVAYQQFELKLLQTIRRFMYPRVEIVKQNGKLCFRQKLKIGERRKFPEVIFHFANRAKFVLNQEAYLDGFEFFYDHVSPPPGFRSHCLLIFPSNQSTVLGAHQQVNHRIIYDVANSELQFEPADCFHRN